MLPTLKTNIADAELSWIIDYSLKIMTQVSNMVNDYMAGKSSKSADKIKKEIYDIMTVIAGNLEQSKSGKIYDCYSKTLGEISRQYIYFNKHAIFVTETIDKND